MGMHVEDRGVFSQAEGAPPPPPPPPPDPPPGDDNNLFVWTTDWHLTSSDALSGGLGDTKPSQAAAVVAHINSLGPAGVIDTGDCKDHYIQTVSAVPQTAAVLNAEYAQYKTNVLNQMAWATVNSGVSALKPVLPGNHDDDIDQDVSGHDMARWDTQMWPGPYHFTCDWPSPQIRFIALHAFIRHVDQSLYGFAEMPAGELTYLSAQLAALPSGWKAIVVCHFPMIDAFGNNVRVELGGATLWSTLAANQAKITCCLNGHRHSNMLSAVQDGITHFSGPGMSYSAGNANGGFMPITYLPGTNQISIDYRLGPTGTYTRYPGFTPIVLAR